MVQLIVGEKGKGKTKELLDKVNKEVKEANGTFVYLDKSRKHMYELNNKVRLIDMSEYDIQNSSEFLGFISGVVSQDNDLEKMFLDSFLKISKMESDDGELGEVLDRLDTMGKKYGVSFVVSLSKNEEDLPENAKSMVLISL
ncbi:MAG TPA: twitching motility protein PilT [Candidatus Blautia stercoripullorum]|uniref:Twitching motility protein PilT n=1 Tax=Candidatus Blautia stercoripullorum TaxID=2838502 RepID=A0A9D2R6Q9_9FIRM|nr:twitching motility protein PilT [Candidatus Blautia stercoripullorum]